jgi:hypothetical protein
MNKFNIGDKVVALSNQPRPSCQERVKGRVYSVEKILYCPTDGHQMINIGPTSENDFYNCSCGKKHATNGFKWTLSREFAKVDNVEEALEEAVANEDYDLAIVLRDINK